MLRVAVVVALGSACSSAGSPGAAPPASPPATSPPQPIAAVDAAVDAFIDREACAARVTALRAQLAAPRTPPHYLRTPVPTVPHWRELGTEPGIEVSVARDGGVAIDGSTAGDRRELATLLAAAARTELEDADGGAVVLAILADEAAPARAVFDVIAAAPEGLEPRLIVRRDEVVDPVATAQVPPDAAPWVATWLDELRARHGDPGFAGKHLQDGLERAAGTACAQLPVAFRRIANANPAEVRRVADAAIPAAIEACACAGVDPGFELIVVLSSRSAASHGWLPLPKRRPRRVRTVADLARAIATP